ncbi:MAG: hypothetical protein IPH94_02505 [Saprospiraceae bacterium]|nr:hypothetical protein [Saprospiraceae bacterium]MBK7220233.1 hypothetical protein [Saprospiraceae bacterium]MBK7787435.1 hypothetical protein [Saprospiraceae bacterium]MBK8109754.1 hypothetical protein [Saprospiraceae bacterium]MBK8849262.1 hypothetical protein [Saprospiraceae bacterium]
MRLAASFFSYLFHPLFLAAYFLLLVYWVNPVFLDFSDRHSSFLIIFSLLTSTILFPGVAIFLMKGLKLIDSIQMRDKKERVGPLIVTGLFYIWVFLNLKNNSLVPEYMSFFMLGASIALFFGFFFTLFLKVSLHTIGMGALTTAFFLMKNRYAFEDVVLPWGNSHSLIIDTNLVFILLLLISGWVATCRLWLKAHTLKQIYAGFLMGVVAMTIAYFIYL